MRPIKSIIIALFTGMLGSFLGWKLMLPAPFLMGPVLVSTLFAILRTDFSVPEQIKQISFILIGISVGSNVTPEALGSFSRWPFSILLMIFSVTIIIFACKVILQKFRRVSYSTSNAFPKEFLSSSKEEFQVPKKFKRISLELARASEA